MNGDDARARLAAANNADVYAAVFAAHGLRFHRDAGLFRAIDPPPPYYSSLTTLDPDETARQLAALDALRAEGRADLGIKDGFCRLDPDSRPWLRVLFEASWLWAPAGAFPQAGAAGWERVTTSEALAAWEAAWAAAGSPTEHGLSAGVLANPTFAFFAGARVGLRRRLHRQSLRGLHRAVQRLRADTRPRDLRCAAGQVASLAPAEPVVATIVARRLRRCVGSAPARSADSVSGLPP